MGHVAPIGCKEGVTLLLLRPVSNRWSRRPILELIPITHDILSVHELRVAGLTLVQVGVDPVLARATVPVALVLAHLAAIVLTVIFLHTEDVGFAICFATVTVLKHAVASNSMINISVRSMRRHGKGYRNVCL